MIDLAATLTTVLGQPIALIIPSALLLVGVASVWARFRYAKVIGSLLVIFSVMVALTDATAVLNYFARLGQDSVLEARDFDWTEAKFFVTTLLDEFLDTSAIGLGRLFLTFLLGLLLAAEWRLLNRRRSILAVALYWGAIAILITAAATGAHQARKAVIAGLEIHQQTAKVAAGFAQQADRISVAGKPEEITVLTYIGESTSAMHMGIYGYHKKTTPQLASLATKPGWIQFRQMMSAHTHTTPSLINALSLCIECSIESDRDFANRASIVDVLNKAGLITHHYSAQGQVGAWNLAASAIFGRAGHSRYARGLSILDEDRAITREYDHEFFARMLNQAEDAVFSGPPSAVFLHSHAGHGPYHFGVPEAFWPQDNDGSQWQSAFFGKGNNNGALVAEYDAAIRYIDFSVTQTLKLAFELAEKNNRPLIFIYSADHGESPATNRGHDSSRLVYEMMHVPFIVVFNKAAQAIAADQFAQLQSISQQPMSLHLLAELMLQLFNIEVQFDTGRSFNAASSGLPHYVPSALINRKTIDGQFAGVSTYFAQPPGAAPGTDYSIALVEAKDTAIRLWQARNYINQNSDHLSVTQICMHRANSLASQMRASLAAGCFETDVNFTPNAAEVFHPPQAATGLRLSHFLESVEPSTFIWLDGKNTDTAAGCNNALSWLRQHQAQLSGVVLEFPSAAALEDQKWLRCALNAARMENVTTAYYVPTASAEKCSATLATSASSTECVALYRLLNSALDTQAIESLSFDVRTGYKAIAAQQRLADTQWQIWGVRDHFEIQKLQQKHNLGAVLLQNHAGGDPNPN